MQKKKAKQSLFLRIQVRASSQTKGVQRGWKHQNESNLHVTDGSKFSCRKALSTSTRFKNETEGH